MPVKLGYAEGPWLEVRQGLKEGDQVVTAGKVALRDGTAVQIIGQPDRKPVAAAAPATAGDEKRS